MEDDIPEIGGTADAIALEYATYEDYLDSQISSVDLYYLSDPDLARQLVELGYRGTGETLKRGEFEARKKQAETARWSQLRQAPKALASAGHDLTQYPFLNALAQREEDIRSGRLTTIAFIRDKNAKGQEVSAYIDIAHRLKTDQFALYFARKKRIMPRASDLSFFNWETLASTSNPTPNFQVIADDPSGLLFKNKRDRKVINVDPKSPPGDNSVRYEIKTKEYVQVVLFDHLTRRKT
eukprot:TRINITY_DN1897_c0_g1_i1.p1 TRINITY_DN1897_c0_g1~~TRINITY_DN1897_c0_g1_i1.p1  ORF type:complete len:238 (-),score=51.41 TRINITY_DN1897_c0_g1_i1:216-929(-)